MGLQRPLGGDCVSQVVRLAEPSPSGPVGADEVGVAELADGAMPVRLVACPQVAERESAEDGWPAGVCAFTLQGVEDFLDLVHASRTIWVWHQLCGRLI